MVGFAGPCQRGGTIPIEAWHLLMHHAFDRLMLDGKILLYFNMFEQ
jgi:hypothetical protein